jgi:hypothetical protein
MVLVWGADCPDLSDWLEPAETDDLVDLVGVLVTTQIKNQLPQVLFWQYSEKNLLPGSINLDDFVSDPDTCLPLKNMFALADVSNIQKAVSDARAGSRNTLHNFFAKIAEKTTVHFRSVWKEHRSIVFELVPDGANLIAGVREKNRFDFSKRSDGFKRFVSFLLLISAKVKSGELSNTILLIDEPDISLHPSGARFLRDELIEISKTNHVIYSTHSIFMIDRESVDRHIIVTKKNEKTVISIANESNIVDEEVIYNAMGYSLFESLNQKNIIFEGWNDKRLFQVATKRLPSKYSGLSKVFAKTGICHARGVKDIRNITPVMELANRGCFIVSDSDEWAREKQLEHQKGDGYGVWKRYDELLEGDAGIVTGEDFLEIAAFRPSINDTRSRYDLPGFDEALLEGQRGKLYSIGEWLRLGGMAKDVREQEIRAIKKSVWAELSTNHIRDVYFEYLAALAKTLDASR